MNRTQFDKSVYQTARSRVIELIKSSHDWEKTEGFIADGIICPDEYERQRLRILCVLAESYGYAEEGVIDIETQLVDDVMGLGNSSVQTPRKLATLLWLLLTSLTSGEKVQWEDLPCLFQVNPDYTSILQTTLSKVAWINVKKASRAEGTSMEPEEVYAHALRNREVLRGQLEAIAPHLLIVCGEVPFRALHEAQLLGPEIELGQKWRIQQTEAGPGVLEVTHPSSWRGYEKLYERFGQIYSQLAESNYPIH